MRRSRRQSESSLELLLDTICNTFGGILFIALLLIVMLQMTSRVDSAVTRESQTDQAVLAELRSREASVRAELEALRRAYDELVEQSADFADPELAKKLEELEKERKEFDERMKERLERLGRIAEQHSKTNEVTAELERMDQELEVAKSKVRGEQEQLELERVKHTQNAELSRQQRSSKRSISLVLRFGRLYVWHEYDADGNRLGPNLEEFAIVEETENHIEIRPLPFAGVPLKDENGLSDRVAIRFERFPSERFYLDIAIWPDTFEAFKRLKPALVQLGFRYRLVPIIPGTPVTDQGSSDTRVQ